jgi:hypothetical protein
LTPQEDSLSDAIQSEFVTPDLMAPDKSGEPIPGLKGNILCDAGQIYTHSQTPEALASRKSKVLWQRAAIGPPVPPLNSVGTLTLMAKVAVEFDVFINAHIKCCAPEHIWPYNKMCWSPSICNDMVHFSGTIFAVAVINVIKTPAGVFQFDVTTKVFPAITATGCHPDRFISIALDLKSHYSENVRGKISEKVKERIMKQAAGYSGHVAAEHPLLLSNSSDVNVTLWYKIKDMAFATSDSIKIFADAYVNVSKKMGSEVVTRKFGQHRTTNMSATWPRYTHNRALLAGFRIAPAVFGTIFQALAFAGVLSPHGNATLYGAHLFFNLTMAEPHVLVDSATAGHAGVATNTSAGMYLHEDTVSLTMKCSEVSPREIVHTVGSIECECIHVEYV